MPRVLRTTIMTLLLIACAAAPAIGQTGGQNRGGPVRDHQRLIQRHVKSWLELRRENIVVQKRDYSCGAAALATLVRYYWGDQVTEEMVLRDLDKMLTREEALDRVKNGLTLTDLRRVAVRAGYQATMGKLKYEKLSESRVPLIIGINGKELRSLCGLSRQRRPLCLPGRSNSRKRPHADLGIRRTVAEERGASRGKAEHEAEGCHAADRESERDDSRRTERPVHSKELHAPTSPVSQARPPVVPSRFGSQVNRIGNCKPSHHNGDVAATFQTHFHRHEPVEFLQKGRSLSKKALHAV